MFIEPSIIQELENIQDRLQELENIQDRAFALYCSRPIFRNTKNRMLLFRPRKYSN